VVLFQEANVKGEAVTRMTIRCLIGNHSQAALTPLPCFQVEAVQPALAEQIAMPWPFGRPGHLEVFLDSGVENVVTRPWEVNWGVWPKTVAISTLTLGKLVSKVIGVVDIGGRIVIIGKVRRRIDVHAALELEIKYYLSIVSSESVARMLAAALHTCRF
jgi:hypothetical protein